jgi:hypothetical protein
MVSLTRRGFGRVIRIALQDRFSMPGNIGTDAIGPGAFSEHATLMSEACAASTRVCAATCSAHRNRLEMKPPARSDHARRGSQSSLSAMTALTTTLARIFASKRDSHRGLVFRKRRFRPHKDG